MDFQPEQETVFLKQPCFSSVEQIKLLTEQFKLVTSSGATDKVGLMVPWEHPPKPKEEAIYFSALTLSRQRDRGGGPVSTLVCLLVTLEAAALHLENDCLFTAKHSTIRVPLGHNQPQEERLMVSLLTYYAHMLSCP